MFSRQMATWKGNLAPVHRLIFLISTVTLEDIYMSPPSVVIMIYLRQATLEEKRLIWLTVGETESPRSGRPIGSGFREVPTAKGVPTVGM